MLVQAAAAIAEKEALKEAAEQKIAEKKAAKEAKEAERLEKIAKREAEKRAKKEAKVQKKRKGPHSVDLSTETQGRDAAEMAEEFDRPGTPTSQTPTSTSEASVRKIKESKPNKGTSCIHPPY